MARLIDIAIVIIIGIAIAFMLWLVSIGISEVLRYFTSLDEWRIGFIVATLNAVIFMYIFKDKKQ